MKKLFSTLISTALILSALGFARAGVQRRARASSGPAQRRGSGLGFNERKVRETSRRLRRTITVKYPQFAGKDGRVTRLNGAISRMVMKQLTDYKKDFAAPEERMQTSGSTFDMGYSVELATNDLVSILFYIEAYYEGAAHPLHSTEAFNYDLNAGKELNLADLFKPNSGYLNLISKYSIDDLKKQLGPDPDTDWIEKGAGPSEENFGSWTVSRKGLEIMFDQYQVASYAEGPHEVLIPFGVLRGAIDPNGPLAKIAR
ncbi:MAG: DUF3298 and DUF4163 domain-containing protein [Acidobacteriota bacterium]|nr:DUF3298 and DUF4163 domain-containing protein [Acidobacteriota bacterium]